MLGLGFVVLFSFLMSYNISLQQVSRLESQLTSLKELSESQSKRAEDLNNKLKQVISPSPIYVHLFLKDSRLMSAFFVFFFYHLSLKAKDEQVAMEEKYRVELNAHVKLSSLYKVRTT